MGVYKAGRIDAGGSSDGARWIRVTSACDQRCVFCGDAEALDGQVRPLEAVVADLDAAVGDGVEGVVLSGGEPTRSPHLLRIVRAAKDRGLRVAMTTHGRVFANRRAAAQIASAGLDEVRISMHSGRRETQDRLVGVQGAWVQALNGMRHAHAEGVAVVLHMVLLADNTKELGHLLHLAMMAGAHRARLYRVAPEGRGVDPAHHVEDREALNTLDRLWRDAVSDGVCLEATGFDRTRDGIDALGLTPWTEPARPPIDAGAVAMLARGVGLWSVWGGCRGADHDGRWSGFLDLAGGAEGVPALAAQLAAWGSPVEDLPPCLGGLGRIDGDTVPCTVCAPAAGCPGIPAALARRAPGIHQAVRISGDRRTGPA